MTGDPRIEARVLSVLVGVAVACAIKAALEKHNLFGKVVLLGDAVHAACVRRISTTRLLQLDSDFIFPVASLHRLIPERWPLRTQQHSGASCLA